MGMHREDVDASVRPGVADRAVVLRIEPAALPFELSIPDAHALRLSVEPAAPMRCAAWNLVRFDAHRRSPRGVVAQTTALPSRSREFPCSFR